MEMMEGETKELCVVLKEPESCTMYMVVTVSLAPDSQGKGSSGGGA